MARNRKPGKQPRAPSEQDQSGSPSEASVRSILAVSQLEHAHLTERTWVERMSDAITGWAGAPLSILAHGLWFTGWIAWNSGVLGIPPIDPYPFGFMTVIVSLEAIFLSLFILKSQNTMQRQADARAHLDLQINLLAEKEATKILEMLQSMCVHFNLTQSHDRDVEDLKTETDPELLVLAIKESMPE
jgi:uncharacterized membrane protein